MQRTLDVTSYLGGLIFGIALLLALMFAIFLLITNFFLDRMTEKYQKDLANFERGFDESHGYSEDRGTNAL